MSFIAEYVTDCATCDEPLMPGETGRMTYDGAAHERCPGPAPADRAACSQCHLVHAVAQEDCDG